MLFSFIGYAILFILFFSIFAVAVWPFFELALYVRVIIVILVAIPFLSALLGFLLSIKNIRNFKDSNLKITDAVVRKKYSESSSVPEDFSNIYYVSLKCEDEDGQIIIKEVEVDSFIFNSVVAGSKGYYTNVSDKFFPQAVYILGDDLLPFYKSKTK